MKNEKNALSYIIKLYIASLPRFGGDEKKNAKTAFFLQRTLLESILQKNERTNESKTRIY